MLVVIKNTTQRLYCTYFDATIPVDEYQRIITKMYQIGNDENIAIR